MYDGWSKVPVPVTQTQLQAKRIKLNRDKILKAKVKPLKKTAKSQPKGKNKGKGRNIDDEMDEIDEMDVDFTTDEDVQVLDWCSYAHTFDVVITTYAVLRSDFNVARAAPDRPRREDVVYTNVERARSPLVMVEWNRVVMDEVQMVGGGKTELRQFFVILFNRRTSNFRFFSEIWSPSSPVFRRLLFRELLHVRRSLI